MTDNLERQETVTIADLLDKHIQTREDTMTVLRTQWIHQVFLQLIEARLEAGLTQAELAHRLDRHQSAIGRLERSDDIKLSTLFDYLSAVGQIPTGKINTLSELEAFSRVARAAGDKKQTELWTFPDWLRQTPKATKYGAASANSGSQQPTRTSVTKPLPSEQQIPDSTSDRGESVAA